MPLRSLFDFMACLSMQEYVTKLGACLVEVRSDTDDSTPCAPTLQLHKWAAEATSLMVCVALRNPWAIKAFNAAVDTNTAAEERDAGCTAQQAHSAQLLVRHLCCVPCQLVAKQAHSIQLLVWLSCFCQCLSDGVQADMCSRLTMHSC